MEELYHFIEFKIKQSGYSGEIDGYQIYNEISDFIEEKEIGTYLFFSKPDEQTVIEYKVEVLEEQFNLSYIKITSADKIYYIDFDCE